MLIFLQIVLTGGVFAAFSTALIWVFDRIIGPRQKDMYPRIFLIMWMLIVVFGTLGVAPFFLKSI